MHGYLCLCLCRYAYDILELEELNRRLEEHLSEVQKYSKDLSMEQGLGGVESSLETKLSCEQEAREMFEQRRKEMKYTVQSEGMAELITRLTGILLQLKVTDLSTTYLALAAVAGCSSWLQ